MILMLVHNNKYIHNIKPPNLRYDYYVVGMPDDAYDGCVQGAPSSMIVTANRTQAETAIGGIIISRRRSDALCLCA
jgi:hypothetical protein